MSRSRRFPRRSRGAVFAAFAAGLTGWSGNAEASLTIDLRLTDGSKGIMVNTGERFIVEIWAIVDGTSTDLTNAYGIQAVSGSIVSSGGLLVDIVGGKGDLDMYRKTPQRTTALRPFARPAEQPGVSQDLDGDGDLDLGAPNQEGAAGFIIVRSDPMEYYGLSNAVQPGPDSSSIQSKIGRVEVTVTGNDGFAYISWLPRRNAAGQIASEAGLWFDDEGALGTKSGSSGRIFSGAPLCVGCPDPSAAGLVACSALGLLHRRRRA